MSDTDNDDSQPPIVEDELEALKNRANILGIRFHPSIGLETLREKVNSAVTARPSAEVVANAVDELAPMTHPMPITGETEQMRRKRKKMEANQLVRCRITCMNPAKSEWEGEIFTAGNALVGSFKKFVPFNNDNGWHIPQILLNMIQDRKCQIFYSTKDPRGNSIRKGKTIKEFNVEIMPNLTMVELQELAQRQAMANTIDA